MTMESTAGLLIAAPPQTLEKLRVILTPTGIPVSGFCPTGEEALRSAQEMGSVLLTTWTLPDMTGTELAERVGDSCEVLMIVPGSCSGDESRPGVLTLTNPVSRDALVQAVRTAMYYYDRMHVLKEETKRLNRTLEERRLLDRAKSVLMSRCGLTESEAHHRIQKLSMDSGRRIGEVSQEILEGA